MSISRMFSVSTRKSEKLWDCVYNGDLEGVKKLMADQGVDPNWTGNLLKMTAFQIACARGQVEVVKFMLDQTMRKIAFNHHEGSTEPAIILAVERGHNEIAEMLLNDERIDLLETVPGGKTAFEIAIATKDRMTTVEIMMASWRDVVGNLDVHDLARRVAFSIGGGYEIDETYKLVKAFADDPMGTKSRLRQKLGRSKGDAADLFALVVYTSDGYLRVSPKNNNATGGQRFFNATSELPLELQMIICNMAVGSPGTLIMSSDSEKSFRKFAKK